MGHLIIASVMVEKTDMDQVWFIVSPQNPLKRNKNLLHEFDRYDMVSLAIQDNYKFKVSDVEFRMPRPSYTIDTLTYLREKHPDHEFALIIGEDNLCQFHNWKNYERILEFYQLYVYPRPEAVKTELSTHPHVKLIDAPVLDISATYIREMVKNDQSIRYLVTREVENFIESKKFFK